MARYSGAYRDFLERVVEVRLLRSKAAAYERSSLYVEKKKDIDALCRGSVVLLSGHVEAYIKELGECLLDSLHEKSVDRSRFSPQIFFYATQERLETIQSTRNPDSIADHVHQFVLYEADLWQRTGPLPTPISADTFSKGFSNPTFKKVKSYFNRFGYDNFRKDFMRKLGPKGTLVETSLDSLVSVRNQIAHGEPSATKTPSELKAFEEDMKLFCRTTDEIFGDWCRRNLCVIR